MRWLVNSGVLVIGSLATPLFAGPRTRRNRVLINKVARAMAVQPVQGCYPCGICGADNRVASNENWSGRLFP